jgi:hypothetical protein
LKLAVTWWLEPDMDVEKRPTLWPVVLEDELVHPPEVGLEPILLIRFGPNLQTKSVKV